MQRGGSSHPGRREQRFGGGRAMAVAFAVVLIIAPVAGATGNLTAGGGTDAALANATANGTANASAPNATANGTANATANGTANASTNATPENGTPESEPTPNGTVGNESDGAANASVPNGTVGNESANATANGTAGNESANATANRTNGSVEPAAANASVAAADGPRNVTIVEYRLDSGTVVNRTRAGAERSADTARYLDGTVPARDGGVANGERAPGRERVESTREYPWSAIAHMEADFGSTSGDCSGTLIDDNHVLTAAHCVYNHDEGGWASELTVSPGTNLQALIDHPLDKRRGATYPFGRAEAERVQTYKRWVDGQHRGFDMAVVTLDRNVGEHTGTFGVAGYSGSDERYSEPAHASGYPTSPPRDPVLTLWDDYSDGGGTSSLGFVPDLGCYSTDLCHALSMTVSSGQSGGPVWQNRSAREGSSTPFVLSVNAAGYEAFGVPISQLPATGVRVTDGKFDDIGEMVERGDAAGLATDKPDLRGAGRIYHGRSDGQVVANESVLSVRVGVLNRGTALAGSFDVTYRAVSAGDGTSVTLGTETVSGVAPFDEVVNVTWSDTVPTMEAGTYTLLAELDANDDVEEFSEYDANVTVGEVSVRAAPENNTLLETRGAFTTDDPYVDDFRNPLDGYRDNYTVGVEEGELLNVHVRPDASHENYAEISLYQPDGDYVNTYEGGPEGDAVLSTHEAQETGRYTVVVTNGGGEETFGYDVHAYTGRPADYAVGYGTEIEGTISDTDNYHAGGTYGPYEGYHDVVTFEGRAGDTVSAVARPNKSHENNAELALYQPDGDYVNTYTGGDEGDAVLSRHTLRENGTYRVIISPGDATEEFDYDFRLYEGLPAERTLAYGTNLSERIGPSDRYLFDAIDGYHDTYAFRGRAGDTVSAEMRPNKSHENNGKLVLYQPDGDYVGTYTNGDEGDAVLSRHTLQESGQYKLVAASAGDGSFDYDLRFYEGLPVDGTLERGRTVVSELSTGDRYLYDRFSGYHETYAFDAEGRDTVSVEMRPHSGSEADAQLLLFSPNGTLVTRGGSGDGGNEVISRYTLPDVDGTYKVVATSGSDTASFGFDLALYGDLPTEETLGAGTWANGAIETTDRYLDGEFNGYHDTYAFEGEAGERAHVRVRATDGYDGLAKGLLYAPNGTLMAWGRGNAPGDDGVVPPQTLPQNGTYRVVVTGDDYEDTFDYSVRVDEQLPADGSLVYGESVNATVDENDTYLFGRANGYHDVYTFEGRAGEIASATVNPGPGIDGTYGQANVSIISPEGDVVAWGRGNGPGDDSIAAPQRLRQNGTYRVIVTGSDEHDTFDYDLRLYEGYPDDGELAYGGWVNGSVTSDDRYIEGVRSGYHDAYTFDGEAGETVGANLQVSGDLGRYTDPEIVLLRPDGSVVASTGQGIGDDAALSRVTLPSDGTYRVIVTAGGTTGTFDYDLHLYESLSPDATLDYGDRTRGNVTVRDHFGTGALEGYYDTYAFAGEAGDVVNVEGRVGEDYNDHAELVLFAPNGTVVAEDAYGDGPESGALLERVGLPSDGTYRVVVMGDRNEPFAYELRLDESFATEGHLSYGERRNGSVTADDAYLTGAPNGYHDAYTFDGEAGDDVHVEARGDPDDENVQLALVAPNGSLVAEDAYGDGIGDGALLSGIDLAANGTYTLVVGADGETTTFDYDLRLREGVTVDGELAYGERTSGAVTVGDPYFRSGVGFHDLYAFAGETGEDVSVEVRTDVEGVTARAVVYGPEGSIVAQDDGSGAGNDAVITLETLPANGTYRVAVAGDAAGSTFGYDLRLYEGISVNGDLAAGETRQRHLDSGDRFLNGEPYNGYHEVFTFEGEAGETTTIEARPADNIEQQAELRLYQPDGDEAAEARHNGDGGNAVIGRHTLLESGEYTLVVTGAGETETFRYDLSRYDGLPADGSLLYGDTVEADVTTDDEYLHGRAFDGYHDVYAFNASAGETVSLNVLAEDATDVNPRLTLYEADGDEVARDTGYDGYAALDDVEIVEGGTHRVVVTSDNTDAMEYTLNLSGPDNNPPRALASADPEAVAVGNTVHLDATASNDPDGDALTYRWTQDDGPDVALRDAESARAAFSAPNVSDGTELTFELRVRDGEGKSDTTEVRVTVRNETDRPVVRAASRTGAADYTTSVPLTLSEAPTGLSGFTVVATVADPSVASVTNAALADAFAAGTVTVGPANESVRVAGVDFEERVEPGDEDIALAAVNLTGGTRGETALSLRVARLDDDRGESVAVGTNAGTFSVPDVESVVPPRVPSDPDRDGLYEDVNGNDALDMDDAVELFRGLSAGQDAVVDHPGPYDFNDNGEVDADDAVELFREIVSTDRTGPGTAVATGGGARVASAAVDADAEGPTVRLSDVTLGPNGTASAALRLSNAPDGLSGFDVRVSAGNGSVVNVTGVTVTERFQPSLSAVGATNRTARAAGADFGANVEPGAENVTLGTVSLAGVAAGETELDVHVARADDDSGGAIAPAGTDASVIVAPNRLPGVRAFTSAVTTHVGAPTRIAGVASDPDGSVTNVSLVLPDGSVVGAGTESEWASEVRFGNSTWNDGRYERVPVRARAVDDDGAANATVVRARVFIAGDATGDGAVDVFDAVTVGRDWGAGDGVADMNNDGEVGVEEAALLGRNWEETAG